MIPSTHPTGKEQRLADQACCAPTEDLMAFHRLAALRASRLVSEQGHLADIAFASYLCHRSSPHGILPRL